MTTTDLTRHIFSKLNEEENGYDVPQCHLIEKNTFLCIFGKGDQKKVLTVAVTDITNALNI